MIRIRAIKSVTCLNCSAGGVLYHYTNSMDNVISIVTKGLKASPYNTRYGDPDEDYIAGVSFSRSRTNTPYTELTGIDDTGSEFQRWKYGVIFSKDKLSNLGKLTPYHWATNVEATGLKLNVRYLEPRNLDTLDNWVPDIVELSIGVTLHRQPEPSGGCKVSAQFRYPEGTAAAADLNNDVEEITLKETPFPAEFNSDSAESEYDHYVQELEGMGLGKVVPIDNSVISCSIFKIIVDTANLSRLPKPIEQIMQDIMQLVQKKIDKHRTAQAKEQSGAQLVVETEGLEPVYFPSTGDTSYDNFLKAIEQLKQIAPDVKCRQNKDTWNIYGPLPEDMSFKDLPVVLQILISRSGVFESEDRLIVPNTKPGEYLTGTEDAVVGIIVPRKEYYGKAVEDFRARFSNIPVYAYAEQNEKSRPKDARTVPREAYQSPKM